MLHSFMLSGIRSVVAAFLIISFISNTAGQTDDILQSNNPASDTSVATVKEDSMSAEKTDSVLPDEQSMSKKSGTKETGYYRGDRVRSQSSMQNRGVSSAQNTMETTVQRKLLPPPVIVDTSNTADTLGTKSESVQNKQYRMGRTEKRILLVTGAVLVTGGLALILAKSFGKDDKKSEDGAGFPEPPRPPEY